MGDPHYPSSALQIIVLIIEITYWNDVKKVCICQMTYGGSIREFFIITGATCWSAVRLLSSDLGQGTLIFFTLCAFGTTSNILLTSLFLSVIFLLLSSLSLQVLYIVILFHFFFHYRYGLTFIVEDIIDVQVLKLERADRKGVIMKLSKSYDALKSFSLENIDEEELLQIKNGIQESVKRL